MCVINFFSRDNPHRFDGNVKISETVCFSEEVRYRLQGRVAP